MPPYSPDFSRIEEAFSKVKSILRRIGARPREALLEATSRALDNACETNLDNYGGRQAYTYAHSINCLPRRPQGL